MICITDYRLVRCGRQREVFRAVWHEEGYEPHKVIGAVVEAPGRCGIYTMPLCGDRWPWWLREAVTREARRFHRAVTGEMP